MVASDQPAAKRHRGLAWVGRWLLVPVSAALVALATVALGQTLVSLSDQRCGADNLIGGACVEPWHTGFVEQVIYGGSVVLALALILLPVLIAPAAKRAVAVAAYLLLLSPFAASYALTRWPELLRPAGVCAVVGGLAVLWVFLRSRHDRAA